MEDSSNYFMSSNSQHLREDPPRLNFVKAIPADEFGKKNVDNTTGKKRPTILTWANKITLMWDLRITIWLVMFAQAIRSAAWMWLYMEIKWAIPHTFAWEALLTPLLSIHVQGSCTDYKSFCQETVYPLIPVISATVSTFQILIICVMLFLENCSNICSFIVTHIISVAEIAFFFLTAPAVSTIIVQYVHHLNNTMRLQMKELNTTFRWKITQHASKCCGVISYEDWSSISSYPESCCDTSIGFCGEGNVFANYLWSEGCFNSERFTFVYYGWMEVIFLCAGLLITLVQHFTIMRFKETSMNPSFQSDNTGSRNIYIRQGTSFVSINQEHETNNIIRVNDITIQTIGVVGSNLGITDSIVSIQICNYGSKDKIILSREPYQIVITISHSGVLRGTVKITAVNRHQLQSVRVVTNSSGSITIQTKESLYYNI